MAEWVSLYNASKISGFSAGWIGKLIRRGVIPADQTRRNGNLWQITREAAERLWQAKAANNNWTNKEPEQPADAVHVTDPLGVDPGFDLAPDAARRLMAIRRNKRIYGDTWSCNRQLVNALTTVRDIVGDG